MIIQKVIGHFGPKPLKCEKCPTSSAHTFLIKNPNDAKFKSKFIILKRSKTLKMEVFPFEACINETEGLEVAWFWQKISKEA